MDYEWLKVLLKLTRILFNIYAISFIVVKFSLFIHRKEICDFLLLNEISISFSISFWTALLFLILIFVINYFKKELKKENKILFYIIKYTSKAAIFPFASILDRIPFRSCPSQSNKFNLDSTVATNRIVFILFLCLFFIMIVGNLTSLVFHGSLNSFKDSCFKKILKYLIITLWMIINVLFLLGASIVWLFSLTLSWYFLILCILLPIELALDLISMFCSCYLPVPTNDH
jgi:hypothetical protein